MGTDQLRRVSTVVLRSWHPFCEGRRSELLGHREAAAAATAAKSLQLCPTLCDPIDGSSLGSSVPGILQASILLCHFLLQGNLPDPGIKPTPSVFLY